MIVSKEIAHSAERFFATVRLDIIFWEVWGEEGELFLIFFSLENKTCRQKLAKYFEI